ncbi:hypothetical protein MES5069_750106 [Mesorhizobium escarrei]|uniref:Uncharacterized protein n=1 Tax=Mesorhizobium escarrei TaxID=666018 RepID=A0ABM9EI83_9HYPH|nr:hypothetical protein MES5069_750106 [Mesorhizobium escarrei]
MTFGSDGGEPLIGGFNLTGDGHYARNLFMMLICANDPPAEAGFSFRFRRHSSYRRFAGLRACFSHLRGSWRAPDRGPQWNPEKCVIPSSQPCRLPLAR